MAEYQIPKDAEDDQIDPTKLLEIQLEERLGTLPSCNEDVKLDVQTDTNLCKKDRRDKRPKQKFPCNACSRVFKNERMYLSHIEIAHSVSYAVPFKCELCSKTLRTRPGVDKHIARHLESSGRDCPGCGKNFHVASQLRHHLKGCLQTLAEICSLCGVRFNYGSSLKRHMLTVHCKEKRYVCKECGKMFKLSRYLKRHLIIHTTFKPFRCKYCSRQFNRSANLDVHLRLHTGVKPYCCDICGMAFTHNVSCKRHRLKHFTDAP